MWWESHLELISASHFTTARSRVSELRSHGRVPDRTSSDDSRAA